MTLDRPHTDSRDDDARRHEADHDLQGQDALPLWGRENSRDEFVEGHYGAEPVSGRAHTRGDSETASADNDPRRAIDAAAPVGEPEQHGPVSTNLNPDLPHNRMFADPRPISPGSTDEASDNRRTDVITFEQAAAARGAIRVGEHHESPHDS